MRVSVDRVGRLVIPKPIRVALGIGPDCELELIPDSGGLRLEPVQRADRPVEYKEGLPVLGAVDGALLTDHEVRRLRDEAQR